VINAQVIDTVLFENFQVDPFPNMPIIPFGSDTTWINADEDGLEPNSQLDEDYRWAYSEVFQNEIDSITGEVNYCASSLSWLTGFLPGNRNWLITPPVHVTDGSYTLHWKSASYQMPRYLDGYLVMADDESNDVFSGAFTDTLFQAASMETITGDDTSLDLSNYTFTPGYIHADGLTNEDYFIVGTELAYGILEPHSVSLSQYAGKTVYFAFLHNSDDDYYISIDDILITRQLSSGATDPKVSDLRFATYPNPVENYFNVMFRLEASANVALTITDVQGRSVKNLQLGTLNAGEHQQNLPLHQLASGQYLITLQAGDTIASRAFVKK
jgi:hypothetical protein